MQVSISTFASLVTKLVNITIELETIYILKRKPKSKVTSNIFQLKFELRFLSEIITKNSDRKFKVEDEEYETGKKKTILLILIKLISEENKDAYMFVRCINFFSMIPKESTKKIFQRIITPKEKELYKEFEETWLPFTIKIDTIKQEYLKMGIQNLSEKANENILKHNRSFFSLFEDKKKKKKE